MRRAAALLVLVVLGLGPGCSKRALGRDEARLAVNGRVQVSEAGGQPWRTVGKDGMIRFGDRVRVEQGSARVQMTGNRTMELRRGSQIELRRAPQLLAGDLLVTAPSAPLTLESAGTETRVAGTARMSRNLALVAAAYAGTVDVGSAGRSLHVPALRQAVVAAAGLVPDRPSPLAYDPLDPWDRRFLADTMELGTELAARSRGFTAQLAPGEGRTIGFYRQLIPALEAEPAFEPSLLDADRSSGETLIGAAIATESRRGTFRDRWTSAFSFRDEGAAWGLVALDQQVTRVPLLASLDLAIGRAATPFSGVAAAAAGPPSPAGGGLSVPPAPRGAGRATAATRPGTAPSRPPVPARPASPPPAARPAGPATPPALPPPVGQPSGELADTLSGLINTVNGVLGGRP